MLGEGHKYGLSTASRAVLSSGPQCTHSCIPESLRALQTFLGTEHELKETWPERENALNRCLWCPLSPVDNINCPA